MPEYSKLKGLAVVTMAEGKKVGTVDELVLDPAQKQVKWLRVRGSGVSGRRSWVPTSAVHAVGEHAVTINQQSDIKSSADAAEAEDLAKTGRLGVGSKAITESGKFLGEVRDYEFAPDTFSLMNVSISRGMLGRAMRVAADKVITIGEDATIVASDAAEMPKGSGASQDGKKAAQDQVIALGEDKSSTDLNDQGTMPMNPAADNPGTRPEARM